jgi:uncharacterized membrane protein
MRSKSRRHDRASARRQNRARANIGLFALLAFTLALATTLAACAVEEPLSARACPPGGTALTYENFGRGFMSVYCQHCHAQAGGGSDDGHSHGVPAGYNFATREDVLRHRERIYARSAAGNTSMPPGPDDPPELDRQSLAEWLACGAP